jgi:hypothetical protein
MSTTKTSKRSLVLALSVAGLLALGGAGVALSDDDDDDDDHERHEHHEHHEHRNRDGGWIRSREDVAPVDNAVYTEECGACHMAYQPGLLPGGAWARVMTADGLGDHYGDDASLPEPMRGEIAAYLEANAGDTAKRSRSRAFSVGSSQDGGLPRITDTRYFRNEHHEIPSRLVVDNPDVGSFSNCNACHQGADEGVYNEHRVRIPGHGRWDD